MNSHEMIQTEVAGGEALFECPQCDETRVVNAPGGRMTTTTRGDSAVLHYGSSGPVSVGVTSVVKPPESR